MVTTAPAAPLHQFPVACLECGCVRVVRRMPTTNLDLPVCPDCGYVGWREAATDDLVQRFARPPRQSLPAPQLA